MSGANAPSVAFRYGSLSGLRGAVCTANILPRPSHPTRSAPPPPSRSSSPADGHLTKAGPPSRDRPHRTPGLYSGQFRRPSHRRPGLRGEHIAAQRLRCLGLLPSLPKRWCCLGHPSADSLHANLSIHGPFLGTPPSRAAREADATERLGLEPRGGFVLQLSARRP